MGPSLSDLLPKRALVGLLLLVGAAGCERGAASATSALAVTVRLDEGVAPACVLVRVLVDGQRPRATSPMRPTGREALQVAVYRDDLPAVVRVEAVGFADEACTVEPSPAVRSDAVEASFGDGVSRVEVLLRRLPAGDGGAADAGAVDAGPNDDAGTPADGGADDGGAPFDAGMLDGGAPVDAGAPDAGPPDAGGEVCDNQVDDNGDGKVDCADKACVDGDPCDDGDLCTAGDQCDKTACQPTLRTCAGALPVCFAPSGCDAGVCLAEPEPLGARCDGGRCTAAARCAPFCDAADPTLVGCYRFENALSDGSSAGNHAALITDGAFVAGVRGRGWAVGDAGLTLGDQASLDCVGDLTVEAWVKLDAWPADGGRFGVVDHDGRWSIFLGPQGELRCQLGQNINVPGVVALGAWHHLGCIRGGGKVRAFVDGQFVGHIDAGTLLTGGGTVGQFLGQNGPSGDVLRGALDGVRIWCRTLDPVELCTDPADCG